VIQDRSFQQRIGRIEGLVQQLEELSDPAVRTASKELVASVMDLNAAGFERVLEVAARFGENGSRLVEGLIRDEALSCLLILYGLHPQDFETRVRNALKSFEGVTVVAIGDSIVHLRLDDHARESALRQAIASAAPDLSDLLIEGSAQSGFVPLSALTGEPAAAEPAVTTP
jgi:hypothetical protein